MAFLIDDGDGTADTIYSMNDEHRNSEMPVNRAVTPSDTHPSVNAPVAATDTFLQINFRHGGVVAGTLLNRVNASGLGASYQETTALVNAGDTLLIPVWTNQTSMMLFLGIRSDSASLDGNALPAGIPNTDAGRRAFAATTILVEFADSWGRVLGDTRSTTNIGDTFAYTLIYQLSETTVRYYRALGFDTAPGSNAFRYYYADTYGGAWKQLHTCTVTVAAGAQTGSLVITVTGITIDLPGGLGGVSSSTATREAHTCLLTRRAWLPENFLAFCRWLRDVLLATGVGRLCVQAYYLL